MKRAYELGFVVRVDAGEDAINETVSQVQAWVEANQLGQVTKIDRWGRRKLAYEIGGQRDGYYVFMQADIEPSALPEIERNLKITPSILRYLIIVVEK